MTVTQIDGSYVIPVTCARELSRALALLEDQLEQTAGSEAALRLHDQWLRVHRDAELQGLVDDLLPDADGFQPEVPGETPSLRSTTSTELSERAGVSVSLVNRLCRNGDLRASRARSGMWLIDDDDADRFALSHQH